MLASAVTSLLFALSAVFAARSARWLGGTLANLVRMLIALAALALWAHGRGGGLSGAGLPFFLLSGLVGFGMGDLAFFQALPHLGPRLTVLLNQCLAIPVAIAVERLWIGTRLEPVEVAWSGVILVGVCLALAPGVALPADTPAPDGELPPEPARPARRPALLLGAFMGTIAAIGQGLGAVLSRKAYLVADAAQTPIDGGTAAYQRMIGGIAFALAFYLGSLALKKKKGKREPRPWRRGLPWALGNAAAGPVLGIACYQAALATTPSGLVLPIVATSPVITIGFAYLIDGERPGRLSVAGGLLAVGASIALVLRAA